MSIENTKEENVRLSGSAVIVIVLLLGGFFFQAYEMTSLGWSRGSSFDLLEILAIISALIRKKTADDIVKDFANGLKNMAFICFIMGAAATIGLVLQEGNVLPTIVNTVTVPLSTVTKGVSSIIMFLLNCIINIIIPSRGGQAAIVIPLMAQIGDMLEISRQIIVTAFSLGDGLTNMINPLDGATFAAIALGGVGSYGKWFKWAAPLTLILIILSCVMLYELTIIGWTGM
ncbi:Na+/H+ antiporter NhaC family protein [Clostridioides sp. ES-S-0048-02]|uniref:Na+/H+ antiporter NhaC family protein n=1 Tax=Clostridioides sp. ES-S-0048-02 TaxID=2770777 RepID=UPI001D1147EA|nr:TIGR00366 family protein [Clostridioides sp. ES-S-0048-02]